MWKDIKSNIDLLPDYNDMLAIIEGIPFQLNSCLNSTDTL